MKRSDSLRGQFIHYLIPSVASLFSLSLYILADTYFIATGVGSVGLTALNIAIPAYSVINATGLMFGVGAGVVYSIARGTGDAKRANAVFNTVVWLAVGVGFLFTLLGTVFAEKIALLLGASPQSLLFSTQYIRTMLSFSVFFILNTTLGAMVRNDGNPRLAMVSMITNSFSNVVLDYIFINHFHWGMWGAALATGLSPVWGLCILSLHWVKKKNSFYLEKRVPDLRLIPQIIRGGISNFIVEMGNGTVIFLFNFTLMALSGDTAVAAYGIVANISLVVCYIFTGIGQGMQPVVSLLFGQGNTGDCRRVLRMGMLLALVLGVLAVAAGLLLPAQLTAIFNAENDPLLAAMTQQAIRVYFVCFAFMGINICCISYFQSILRASTASALSLLRGFGLVLAGVAILPRFWRITGVWLVTPVAELITLFICLGAMLWEKRPAPSQESISKPVLKRR